MIMSFQELKSEEHVLNLVFCLNYFDYSQSVGRRVSGRWTMNKYKYHSINSSLSLWPQNYACFTTHETCNKSKIKLLLACFLLVTKDSSRHLLLLFFSLFLNTVIYLLWRFFLPIFENEETATRGVLWKKGTLKNFAKIHKKTPMLESLFE